MIGNNSAVMRSGYGNNVEFDTIGSVIDVFNTGTAVKLYNEYNNSFQRIVSAKSQSSSSDYSYYALKFMMNNDSGHTDFELIVSGGTDIGVITGDCVTRWVPVNKLTGGTYVSNNIMFVSCVKRGYNGTMCEVLTDCGYFIAHGVAIRCF